jgi:transcriptional regulator with XRE-family HTH domain
MRSRIDFHIRVGKKIREIRERLAISDQELAEKSHLSLNIVNSIESGNRDIKISELHRERDLGEDT